MVLVSQAKAWLLAGATLVAGLGVVVVVYTGQREAEPPAPDAPPPSVAVPEPQPEAEPAPQAPTPAAPAFDVVRVAEDGGALVAGSALAGSAVVLHVDGAVVAETSADNAGQFVSLFTLAPNDAVQIMTLEMVLADGRVVPSEDRVVLAPRPEAVAALAEAAPESVALAAVQPEPTSAPVVDDTPPVRSAAPMARAPGHEDASAVLGQAAPPADDSEGMPGAGRDLPPAPTVATGEVRADVEPEARQTTVNVPSQTPGAAALPAAGETAPPMHAALPEAQGPGHEAASAALGQAAAPADDRAEVPMAGRDLPPAPPVDASDEPAPQALTAEEPAPELRQAMVNVPGQTPEAASLPVVEQTAPRPAALSGAQGPGHEAAASVLEGGATTEDASDASGIDAETDAAIAVGEAPPPPPAAPAARPVEAPTAGATASASGPAENLVPRAFVLRGSGEVALLDRAPEVMDNIVIDMISYSDAGAVQISGRAASADAGARVQIYLDNQPIAIAVAENGDWISDLPEVDPGVYALRVDQLDSEGQVVSRFETPFQREDPARVRAARAQGDDDAGEAAPTEMAAAGDAGAAVADAVEETAPVPREATPHSDAPADAPADIAAQATDETVAGATIEASAAAANDLAQTGGQQSIALMTVQPGHSLWRISEGHYGAGDRYLVIYNANRGQIRNPDLIYPGQIFVLPE